MIKVSVFLNDFHVGEVPYVPMSAYEPKHHSVEMKATTSQKKSMSSRNVVLKHVPKYVRTVFFAKC